MPRSMPRRTQGDRRRQPRGGEGKRGPEGEPERGWDALLSRSRADPSMKPRSERSPKSAPESED